MRPVLLSIGLCVPLAACSGPKNVQEHVQAHESVVNEEAGQVGDAPSGFARLPIVRDVYRQAALEARSQIESTSIEDRLRILATRIERETKENL